MASIPTRRRTLLVVSVITFLSLVAAQQALGGVSHTYANINSEQEAAITWALDLYDRSGLELPPIEFVGEEDREACYGRDGMAKPTDAGALITICAAEIGNAQEWVVLHEIAHAWDYHSLEDETRTQFLTLRGHAAWREGKWHERGSENAAEIIAWGLIDRPSKPVHIYGNSCEELLDGYLTLTGQDPLHGMTEACSK